MNQPNKTTPKDKKTLVILKWIFSVIAILLLIVCISEARILASAAFLLITFLLIPPLNFFFQDRLPFLRKRPLKLTLLVFIGIIGLVNFPTTERSSIETNPKSKEETPAHEFSEYIRDQHNREIALDSAGKIIRKQIIRGLTLNPVYKDLVLNKVIDQKYLILLQISGEGMVYSATDGTFSITEQAEKRSSKIPDGLKFSIDVIRLEMFGGLTKEVLDIFSRYKDTYGITHSEGDMIYNFDGTLKLKIEKDFTLIQSLAVINSKDPKVLDDYYEAIQRGAISWNHNQDIRYMNAHLTDKYVFNDYLKEHHTESEYFTNYKIKISAKSLFNEYDQNEVVADDNYKGKKIAVTGTIKDIGVDILDHAYITMYTQQFGVVQSSFAEKDAVRKLKKGESLTVVGECLGKTLGNVIIDKCVVF